MRNSVNIFFVLNFLLCLFLVQLVFMVEKYGDTGVDERAIGWRAGILVRKNCPPLPYSFYLVRFGRGVSTFH